LQLVWQEMPSPEAPTANWISVLVRARNVSLESWSFLSFLTSFFFIWLSPPQTLLKGLSYR
jgi:hypothetical protein